MPLTALALAAVLGACVDAPWPDGNELMRGVLERQRDRERQLETFTYDLLEVREDVDPRGVATGRKSSRYTVFYAAGTPIRTLVEKDGRPLSDKDAERERQRAAEMATAARKGGVARERPGMRLSATLEGFDFRAVDRGVRDERCTFTLEFAPRPGSKDVPGGRVVKNLRGRIFLDEERHEITRAEVRNTSPIRIALGLGATLSTLDFEVDFRLVDGLFMPARATTYIAGKKFLFKGFRVRSSVTFSNFQRFSVESQEALRPPTGP